MRVAGCVNLSLVAWAGVVVAGVSSSLMWPEHGVVKVGVNKSPANIVLDFPGCVNVSVDWKKSLVTAVGAANLSEKASLESGPRMVPEGGRLIGLLMMEERQMHVVVNTEMDGGGIESQTLRVPMESCPLTTLKVSSPGGDLVPAEVEVSVSKEINDILGRRGEAAPSA